MVEEKIGYNIDINKALQDFCMLVMSH